MKGRRVIIHAVLTYPWVLRSLQHLLQRVVADDARSLLVGHPSGALDEWLSFQHPKF